MILWIIAALTLGVLLLKHAGVTWFGIDRLDATTVLLVGGFGVGVWQLWRMQLNDDTTYDALDLVTDKEGRASLDAHIIIVMAALALWWIVDRTLAGQDVSERLIDILMIFVIYRAASKGIDAYSKKAGLASADTAGSAGAQLSLDVTVPPVPPPAHVRPVKSAKMAGRKMPVKTSSGKLLPHKAVE